MAKLSHFAVPWIPNLGQLKSKDILYYTNLLGGAVAITKDAVYYYFYDDKNIHVIKEKYIGAKEFRVKPGKKAQAKVNYFVGKRSNWKSGIPTYQQISLGEIYPGIEISLKAYGARVEKLVKAKKGADLSVLKIAYEGVEEIKETKGKVVLKLKGGKVWFEPPVAWDSSGRKFKVKYVVEKNGWSFVLADADWEGVLTIDPLLASTYLGGEKGDNEDEKGLAVIVDSSGDVYVAGYTTSDVFPTTAGAYDTGLGGEKYAFVSKFSGDLKNLLASTYLGGNDDDEAHAIAIDSSGNVYVAGYTRSADFPTTAGAYDANLDGGEDAFVSKLSGDLSSLDASTYLGGKYDDGAYAIAIDSSGNVYVAGYTWSDDFPTTAGAYDTNLDGGEDAFVSKLSGDLSSLNASTYLGGKYDDGACAIALDSSGNVYVAGYTYSNDFPTTAGAYDASLGGWKDAFVSKLSGDLSSLDASTYLGGDDDYDEAYAIALDSSGNVYVAGWTWSSDFPTTTGAYDTNLDGGEDAFVSKLSGDLSSLDASTYLGGSDDDEARAIAIDSSGNVYVTGYSKSADFPVVSGCYDAEKTGGIDIVVSKLNSSLQNLTASTYLGGYEKAESSAIALAVDSSGNVHVTGQTSAVDFPTTSGAYSESYNGNKDVFVSKFDSSLKNLLVSTYLGGSDYDEAHAIVLDSSGNVYVAGCTSSDDFPTTSGAYDTGFNSIWGGDVFISKLSGDLSSLNASTYLGGSDYDKAYGIVLDSSGNVYVAGYTESDDFPTTTGAYDTKLDGGKDAFVSKLSGDLSSLNASTYLGGNYYDEAYGIVLDSSGNVYVAGYTKSNDFPTSAGAYDEDYNNGSDAFVSKLSGDLSSLNVGTYLGGNDYDKACAIALDPSGNVYVAGYTWSSDFPTTTGAYDEDYNNGSDAFVSKLSGDLSSLNASTYLGGNDYDKAYAIALDPSGNVYVAGYTYSDDFPTTAGAYDTSFNGGWKDAFVSKLSSDLSSLDTSTYLGGSSSDKARAIALDSSGNVYVAGFTWSGDFPTTTGAYCTTLKGACDAFITKLSLPVSPAAPSNLEAKFSDGKVLLSWKDNSQDEEGFYIYRSQPPKSYPSSSDKIASVGANTTSYVDKSINGSGIYYYRVAAFKGELVSNYSNVAEVVVDFYATSQEGTTKFIITNNVVEKGKNLGVFAREKIKVKIYSLKGTFIDEFEVEPCQHFEYIKKLGKGIYILVVQTESKEKFLRKVLVK